jgi:hypothetical protein
MDESSIRMQSALIRERDEKKVLRAVLATEIEGIEDQLGDVNRKIRMGQDEYKKWRWSATHTLVKKRAEHKLLGLRIKQVGNEIGAIIRADVLDKNGVDPHSPLSLIEAAGRLFKVVEKNGYTFTDEENELIRALFEYVKNCEPEQA